MNRIFEQAVRSFGQRLHLKFLLIPLWFVTINWGSLDFENFLVCEIAPLTLNGNIIAETEPLVLKCISVSIQIVVGKGKRMILLVDP